MGYGSCLICVNARKMRQVLMCDMVALHTLPDKWFLVSIAPRDVDLELCVMELGVVHALIFPARRDGAGWVDAESKKHLDIAPTHWRKWSHSR
jgi:hypothetical protein